MALQTPFTGAQTPVDSPPPPPSIEIFARKMTVALGIFALFALAVIVLWQGAEVFLLVFVGFLLAVFLRTLSEF